MRTEGSTARIARPRSMIRHHQVQVGDASIHIAETGPADAPAFLLVHGWPESWRTWQDLMLLAGRPSEITTPTAAASRLLAIDLPGIGASTRGTTGASKAAIAGVLRRLIVALQPRDLTLVGHDIGGMVVYAYLREFTDLPRAVIMDVPVPGVELWDDFVRAPFLWHFALHAVPQLPELLTAGNQKAYFDYFYDLLSAHPRIPQAQSRAEQAAAYSSSSALTAGFDWYRAFPEDVEHNLEASRGASTTTRLLYLRGSVERGGDIDAYAGGFRRAGISSIETATVEGSGHFPQEEATARTWSLIRSFASESAGQPFRVPPRS
jgi:pimeloyl-ACP methyl ester carboxylesterase